MTILLNSNSNIFDLIVKKDAGDNREYLLKPNSVEKLDNIVFVSNYLKNKMNITPNIMVKYEIGSRAKIIDIVFILMTEAKTVINICKITKFTKFDKDCFELLSIIDEMKRNDSLSNYNLKGLLYFTSEYDQKIVSDFFLHHKMDLYHQLII